LTEISYFLLLLPLKEGIVVKAEGIGGEREGDFTDNFNNVWKNVPELLWRILSKTWRKAFI